MGCAWLWFTKPLLTHPNNKELLKEELSVWAASFPGLKRRRTARPGNEAKMWVIYMTSVCT